MVFISDDFHVKLSDYADMALLIFPCQVTLIIVIVRNEEYHKTSIEAETPFGFK